MSVTRGIIVAGAVLAMAAAANGTVILTASHAGDSPPRGGSLDNVRMGVDLSVSAGLATFTFTNLSVAPETSAVIKDFILDTVDDDTGLAVLWNGTILTNTSQVRFNYEDSNGLPGFPQAKDDGVKEFEAHSPAPVRGLNIGESMQVRFNTYLGDGSTIEDYLASFGGGQDTAAYATGFHAISSSTVGGGSLSGAYGAYGAFGAFGAAVPEPTTTALLVLGGVLAIIRRRNRRLAMS